MGALRLLAVVVLLVVGPYTAVVMANEGPNLFPAFFGDMLKLGWAGQFNLDFMFMLMFSGLWVAWRHQFSGAGIALGIGAFFLGAPFVSVYLLVHMGRVNGDAVALLIGEARAQQRR